MRLFLLALLPACSVTFGQAAATPKPSAQTAPKPAPPKSSGAAKPAPTPAAAKPAAPANDPVVFTVGGETMTGSQFDRFLAAMPEQVRAQAATPQGKREMAEKVAELKAMAQEAKRRKLDESSEVKQQIALNEEQVLASNLFQLLMKSSKPSPEAAQKYYEEHKSEYDTAKARHILIRFQGSRVPLKPGQKDLTDAEALAKAQEIRKKLAGGADFSELAKAESDDTGSGANGGDLGSFGRGRMVPQFEQVVFSLPPGEISEPTKTPFGYHIIHVQERKQKPLEEVRAEIDQKLSPEEAKKQVEEIRKKANIQLNDQYFAPK